MEKPTRMRAYPCSLSGIFAESREVAFAAGVPPLSLFSIAFRIRLERHNALSLSFLCLFFLVLRTSSFLFPFFSTQISNSQGITIPSQSLWIIGGALGVLIRSRYLSTIKKDIKKTSNNNFGASLYVEWKLTSSPSTAFRNPSSAPASPRSTRV